MYFRSRNVFLRVTDKRKYCYYSFYVWGCTLSMAAIALFCHFVLDVNLNSASMPMSQRQLGWSTTFFIIIFRFSMQLLFFRWRHIKLLDQEPFMPFKVN